MTSVIKATDFYLILGYTRKNILEIILITVTSVLKALPSILVFIDTSNSNTLETSVSAVKNVGRAFGNLQD